jgi:hypothetical protein
LVPSDSKQAERQLIPGPEICDPDELIDLSKELNKWDRSGSWQGKNTSLRRGDFLPLFDRSGYRPDLGLQDALGAGDLIV